MIFFKHNIRVKLFTTFLLTVTLVPSLVAAAFLVQRQQDIQSKASGGVKQHLSFPSF